MKIKILKITRVKGSRVEVGDVVDASETDAQLLVGMGKAELTNDTVKKNVEPTMNKAKGLKKAVKKIFKK
jgi:hypothetical protein